MKKNKMVYWLFACLPLVITGLVLPAMPDAIPAHYGANGIADRWGSKYELLILPLFTVGIALVLCALTLRTAKKQAQAEKALRWISTSTLLVFNVMTVVILAAGYNLVADLSAGPVDFMSALSVIFGVSMVILGNFLPKLQQNGVVGIRLSWTLKNADVWRDTHRFGGVATVVFGVALIALNLLWLRETASMVALFTGLGIWLAVLSVYAKKRYDSVMRRQAGTP